MDSSSSSSSNKKVKLSVRKQTLFKKPSTSMLMRQETILKKAGELCTLCDNQICVLHYDRDGNFVKAWPEDESQVQDIAEKYSQLTVEEKRKKNTNLSKFFNKKMHDEKKRFPIKFSKKVQDLEGSLVNKLHLIQDMLRETDQSRLAPVVSEQNHNLAHSYSSLTNLLMNGTEQDMTAATNAMNHQSSKFSIFMFNHEDATFTQLPHSSLEQSYYNNLEDNRALLGAQGFNFVGYDNNSVSTALPGEQVNFGYHNSLGFGHDNNLNTHSFNFGCDFNNLCA